MQLSTFLTSSPARLASYISRLKNRDQTLLFSLSLNLPPDDLAKLVRQLTTFSPRTLGCLSAPLPHHHSRNIFSCSFAFFDSKTCTPFRSQIPGREVAQVGRYHSFRRREVPQRDSLGEHIGMSDEVDWNSVWDQSIVGSEPPPELRGVNPEDVKSIIYLTDGAPEGLSNSLSQFSGSHKLGLFAASTPFVTGRSVTLFLNDEICDSGAVGLALKQEASCGLRFHGMEPLAEPMIVSQSEGNLVILLDNKTPTQLLLSAIKQKGINLQTPDYEEFCLASIHDHEPKQMFSILSGDPSRGTIALQSNSSPPSGSRVQFFYRPKTTTAEVAATLSRGTFSFTTVPEALLGHNAEEEVADLELPDSFLAGSEKGFLVSRGKETPWTCSIPGSSAVLHWST